MRENSEGRKSGRTREEEEVYRRKEKSARGRFFIRSKTAKGGGLVVRLCLSVDRRGFDRSEQTKKEREFDERRLDFFSFDRGVGQVLVSLPASFSLPGVTLESTLTRSLSCCHALFPDSVQFSTKVAKKKV